MENKNIRRKFVLKNYTSGEKMSFPHCIFFDFKYKLFIMALFTLKHFHTFSLHSVLCSLHKT